MQIYFLKINLQNLFRLILNKVFKDLIIKLLENKKPYKCKVK